MKERKRQSKLELRRRFSGVVRQQEGGQDDNGKEVSLQQKLKELGADESIVNKYANQSAIILSDQGLRLAYHVEDKCIDRSEDHPHDPKQFLEDFIEGRNVDVVDVLVRSKKLIKAGVVTGLADTILLIVDRNGQRWLMSVPEPVLKEPGTIYKTDGLIDGPKGKSESIRFIDDAYEREEWVNKAKDRLQEVKKTTQTPAEDFEPCPTPNANTGEVPSVDFNTGDIDPRLALIPVFILGIGWVINRRNKVFASKSKA